MRGDQGSCVPQRLCPVGGLPGEVLFVTAEMAVSRGLSVNGAMQSEVRAERGRPQVEVLRDQLEYPGLGDAFGAERLDQQGQRAGDADRVGDLYLGPVGQPSGDDVLGDVAGRVCG